jgi:hypothetical protein
MDLWAAIVKQALRLPITNWALVGRWFGHMPSGTFRHRNVADAPPVRGELALGWAAHYAIGIAYGVMYTLFVAYIAGDVPRLLSALLFSFAMLVFPWLVMQPALGGGVFASRTPRPNLARSISLSMHAAFGIGLYLGSRLLAAI